MSALRDEGMQEIVDEFLVESLELVDEMDEVLENAEENPKQSPESLEKFGLLIDRIMGTAKSLGLEQLGAFCELGKTVGYKGSQINDQKTLSITVGVLFDALDVLKIALEKTKKSEEKIFETGQAKALFSRLQWLSTQFAHIQRSSVAFGQQSTDSKEDLEQKSIDELLANFGL